VESAVDVGEPAAEADGDAGKAGHRWRWRWRSRWPSEVLVDSGIAGGIASSCLIRLGRVALRRLPPRPAGGAGLWEGGMVAQGGGRSPFVVTLTASQRRLLKRPVRRPTAQQRQVTRVRIVLLAAAGLANAAIARKLEIAPNTVAQALLPGGLRRPGRPQAARPPARLPTSRCRLRQGGRL